VAEVLLFHHAQGLTAGVRSFADLDTGVGHAQEIGVDTVVERGRLAAQSLPDDVVHAGFSLGVMPAQMLAQPRPGAKGAWLLSLPR
jgi:hypothetical protein